MIVGANASGKSNLRDALRFLHGIGRRYSLAEIIGERYGPGGVLEWRGIRGGIREIASHGHSDFAVQCSVRGPTSFWMDYAIGVDVSTPRTGPRLVTEHLHESGSYVWDSNPDEDPVEQRAAHQLTVRLPRGGNYRKTGPTLEFASNRACLDQIVGRESAPEDSREHSASMLASLASMRFLDLDPEAMRHPSQPGIVILGDRGENLSSVLQSIYEDDATRGTLLSWVRALTPMDVTEFEFEFDLAGRVMVVFVESTGARTSALSASDGTLRFLALVAALLSPDSGRLYFFEEFDNGIHPTRLHLLLLQLVQQTCRRRNVQVVGTTHNPAMLAFLDEEARRDALLVYRSEESPFSKVRRIMDLPGIEELLQKEDLGRLYAAGWLEDAAAFSEPDPPVAGHQTAHPRA